METDRRAHRTQRPRSDVEQVYKVLSAVESGIVWTDVEGRAQGANAAFAKLIGLPETQILGRMLPELLPLEDDGEPLPAALHPFRVAVSQSGPGQVAYQYLRERQRIELEISWVRCVPLAGAEEILVFTVQDITENKWANEREAELLAVAQKRAAELTEAYQKLRGTQQELIQAEKLLALGRFALGLAHEVKNPLAVILAGIESLQRKVFQQSKPDLLNDMGLVKEAILKASFVVDRLLEFARPSPQSRKRIPLEALIQTAISFLKHKMLIARITVETEWSQTPLWVEVAKNQVEQVFLNLLMNAIDAMPRGGVIRLKTYRDGLYAVASVMDQGEGILEEHLPRLFEPFFTTKGDTKGVGLGLSICKSIVENYGGIIEVESQVGKGSVFRCRFPLAKEG